MRKNRLILLTGLAEQSTLISSDCKLNESYCRCHPLTGVCECKAGWSGATCSRPCPYLTWGKGCHNQCTCKNYAQCSPVDGTCICAAGYRGKDCNETCPQGTFGEDCAQKCNCRNSANCSTETGQCYCKPGKNKKLIN